MECVENKKVDSKTMEKMKSHLFFIISLPILLAVINVVDIVFMLADSRSFMQYSTILGAVGWAFCIIVANYIKKDATDTDPSGNLAKGFGMSVVVRYVLAITAFLFPFYIAWYLCKRLKFTDTLHDKSSIAQSSLKKGAILFLMIVPYVVTTSIYQYIFMTVVH